MFDCMARLVLPCHAQTNKVINKIPINKGFQGSKFLFAPNEQIEQNKPCTLLLLGVSIEIGINEVMC